MIHYEKIPNRIKMGGQELAVKRVERCSDNSVGEMCLAAGYIEIADKFNKDNIQSESSKVNTLYILHPFSTFIASQPANYVRKLPCGILILIFDSFFIASS